MEEYKVIVKPGSGEIVEKKSRFISHVLEVETEEEACQYIEAFKKRFWDARHNCYAYIIGSNSEIKRFSDDGEPSGTAGKPILEMISGRNITNVLVIVTRYFGGTLLGTGGLIRAYGQATKDAIENAIVATKYSGINVSVETDYNGIGKLQYIAGQMGIKDFEVNYTEKVIVDVTVKEDEYNTFEHKVTEATNGKAVFGEKVRKDIFI